MECIEERVDMRKMLPEDMEEGMRGAKLMFKLNHTEPMIAANAQIISNNHDPYDLQVLLCKPVLIKEGAWIGAGATILPGVCVGKHAIVGAMSVVTKDVPDYCVAIGSPAKVVKELDRERFQENEL